VYRLPPGVEARSRAFTLVELLIVIAIIFILAAILMPVLNKAEERSRAALCLSNKRQMTLAYNMYPDDYNGELTPNYSGLVNPDGTLATCWVMGGMTWPGTGQDSLYPITDNTNVYYLQNSLLGPYCGHRTDIYKCPSDTWKLTTSAINNGGPVDRMRSVSMNITIEGNAWQTVKTIPQNESWWYTQRLGLGTFYAFNYEKDYIHIGPANLFVYLDEQADSINDGNHAGVGNFAADPSWGDLPAAYHNRCGEFSFADGHAEIHRWVTPNIVLPVIQGTYVAPLAGHNQVDYQWYISHSLVTVP